MTLDISENKSHSNKNNISLDLPKESISKVDLKLIAQF